jgi:hypothetical protein
MNLSVLKGACCGLFLGWDLLGWILGISPEWNAFLTAMWICILLWYVFGDD